VNTVSEQDQPDDRTQPTEPSVPQEQPHLPAVRQPAGLEQVEHSPDTGPDPHLPAAEDGPNVAGYVPEDWLSEIVTLTVQGRQQMDRVESRVEALTRWPERLEQRLSEALVETEALRDAMEGIQKELKRLGRQQFKANTLGETRTERWQDTVETLESALSRREGEIAAVRFEHRQAVEAARQEWLSALLPILDGLQDAFAAGNAQLDRLQARYDEKETKQRQPRSLLARFRRSRNRSTDAPDHDALTSLSAWLDGLRVLRDRTWALLETGGVRVLPTVGRPFDPHLHIAVDTLDRSDIAAGTVVEERRSGYRVGERVIRFAEVVVARSPTARETEQGIETTQSFEEQG
jgi:molecular chaperone GrpE